MEVPANLDPTRRSARVTLEGAPAVLVAGARAVLVDLARLGFCRRSHRDCPGVHRSASDYAKVRQQFGRPIATFQAVKHHCANMLVAAELATAAVWDAARAADAGGDQLTYTAAMAATLAVPAADLDAQLNIQVHGGIGFTWEHDAHLYLRRATAIEALIDAEAAAIDLTDLVRRGVSRVALHRSPARGRAHPRRGPRLRGAGRSLDGDAQRQALIESGYVMPHWPKPWGRDAGAIEQLVVEEEFADGRRSGARTTGSPGGSS